MQHLELVPFLISIFCTLLEHDEHSGVSDPYNVQKPPSFATEDELDPFALISMYSQLSCTPKLEKGSFNMPRSIHGK